MIDVINKIIAKVEAGRGMVEEFTPTELKRGAFDSVVVPISDQEDIDTYREILNVMNVPVYEMLEEGEEYEVELASCNDHRPTMLMADEQGVVHYDSFFHSEPCEIGGNAYRFSLSEESAFFLIKVMYKEKPSYELYLSSNMELNSEDEEDEYILHNETTPLCNSNTEELQVILDNLYKSFHRRMHQPKITEHLKKRLEKLLHN